MHDYQRTFVDLQRHNKSLFEDLNQIRVIPNVDDSYKYRVQPDKDNVNKYRVQPKRNTDPNWRN